MPLAFSQACENNKEPILNAISPFLASVKRVFEIGSGTGQHAVYFAEKLPYLQWQATDRHDYLPDLKARCLQSGLSNLLTPFAFDVEQPWLFDDTEAIFSANSLHIMSWGEVEHFFMGVGSVLKQGGYCCIYGPFNYNGAYTSESNAGFDQWLKNRDALSGIRDFEAVNALAEEAGMRLCLDNAMPANNRCLIWKKRLG